MDTLFINSEKVKHLNFTGCYSIFQKKKKENEIKGLRGSDKYVALSTLST